MKLMEEIMELDQEIKLKHRWVNARMKLLHNFLGRQTGEDKVAIRSYIEKFLLKMQPEYPKKVSYDAGVRVSNEAIPMPMDSGEAIALEMFKGEPIMLMTREEIEKIKEQEERDAGEKKGSDSMQE